MLVSVLQEIVLNAGMLLQGGHVVRLLLTFWTKESIWKACIYLKEFHEIACREGEARGISLFLYQTLYILREKVGVMVQNDDTGEVGVSESS